LKHEHDQLLIVQKYESFVNYFYPVAQNIPRAHGVVRQMFVTDMLGQVNLFIQAGKNNQVSRLYAADAGLAQMRYWLRFMSDGNRGLITIRQHQVGDVMLSEVGKILGSWIKRKQDSGRV